MKKTDLLANDTKRIDGLCEKIAGHIRTARNNVIRAINTEQVTAYWLIGRDIVEEEQAGKKRANYGAYLLQEVSNRLAQEFGKGFGLTTIKYIRLFYLAYPPIRHAVRDEFIMPDFKDNLSWTHYRILMKISNEKSRSFYEIEASSNNWSYRELDRQVNILLFERLAKSKDKQGLMNLAYKGQEIIKPEDAIKEPMIFEFLGFPESHKIVESELEEALINKLQNFLLELGKGISFVARQKRLTLDGDHFYVDLVMYHTILKSYILIDIKTHAVTHADLGQMQLYRNYYDMECLSEGDNQTIGLILCTEKNKKMVKYFLGDNNKNIFASKYQLNLPTEEELEKELQKEIKEIKYNLAAAKNSLLDEQ
jgi:predicted nuclease of restriction endonuclease-like (RecB) superfamily